MATTTLAQTSAGQAAPAIRFHLSLADRTETEAVDRYRRTRQLAIDIVDAARRADAVMRLEMTLARIAGPHHA